MQYAGASPKQIDSLSNHFLAKSYHALSRKDVFGKVWYYEWKGLAEHIKASNIKSEVVTSQQPAAAVPRVAREEHSKPAGKEKSGSASKRVEPKPKARKLFIEDYELKEN